MSGWARPGGTTRTPTSHSRAGARRAAGSRAKVFREKLGLSQDELDELLEKAFTAVDGLWFLGVEEAVVGWENLKRAGREKIVRCHEVDQEMFAAALRAVDPTLRLEWIESRPQGATTCRWRIHTEPAAST